jgi:integrase
VLLLVVPLFPSKLAKENGPRNRIPMRRGEVMALRWSAVDLDAEPPTLRIDGTLQRGADSSLVVLPPKTQRARRIIPVPPSMAAAVRAVRKEQNERRLLAGAAWATGEYASDRGDGGRSILTRWGERSVTP